MLGKVVKGSESGRCDMANFQNRVGNHGHSTAVLFSRCLVGLTISPNEDGSARRAIYACIHTDA